jgi:site-specific DNA-methyltransferase (adenine-specific)
MNIEQRPIDQVIPYDKNPRLNDSAVDAVAKSLQEFGWRQPVVVDKDGVIVVGHTRWKAAQKLGMQSVPVHVATELTPAQARVYRIADNATGGIATWDMDLLPVEIKELEVLDFDLDLLGFTDEQVADMMAGPDGEVEEDDAPAVQKQACPAAGRSTDVSPLYKAEDHAASARRGRRGRA